MRELFVVYSIINVMKKILKILAVINVLFFVAIMIDFAAEPVASMETVQQFGGRKVSSGKWGHSVQHYIQLKNGETVNLQNRSKFEDIKDVPIRVYKTPYFKRNKAVEIQWGRVTSMESASLFGGYMFFIMLIIAFAISLAYLHFLKKRQLEAPLGVAVVINIALVLLLVTSTT